MISNFTYFLYNNNLNDYMNCYSTFLMTRKDLKDNVLNHRMNFLINYYINQEKLEPITKNKLIRYYISSYKDDYIKPSLEINENNKNENNDKNENNENDDDEIDDHYKYMFVNTKPKQPIIDYDEIDKEYALKLQLEEEEKQREKEIQQENDYDDYYDDDENYDILNDELSDEDNIDYECYY